MTAKKTLIAANWKMHKTVPEAVAFVAELQDLVGAPGDREVLIPPAFTALWPLREAMRAAGFALGAQNCHDQDQGAFTGEVSLTMLRDAGCRYVLTGHSERRHLFGETDAVIQRKVAAIYRHQLIPVLCLGELLPERQAGRTFEVIERQLRIAAGGLEPVQAEQLVVAYEPVWAIGTGQTATPDQAQEVHAFLRETLEQAFDKTVAKAIRIVYGGSVKPDNVDRLMAQADIDGLLVGGASLDPASFARIVRYQLERNSG